MYVFLFQAELSECASHCALCEAALNRRVLTLFLSVRVSYSYPGTMLWTVLDPLSKKNQQQQYVTR